MTDPAARELRAALKRLLAVAMIVANIAEEYQSRAIQDEWIAAVKQARTALQETDRDPPR